MIKPARIPEMEEFVSYGVCFSLLIMILEPDPTLFGRVFFCICVILGSAVIGYVLRKFAMWQIARDKHSEESKGC